MKKVLILVLSADFPPYNRMIETSLNTWDSVEVEGCETVFYCGLSEKPNTDKIIYMPIQEALLTMGKKLLLAFEWALKNKEFDFLARPHSCIYVDKLNLINYVQQLPEENVLAGLEVKDTPQNWLWGGCGILMSKDIVQKIVDNKKHWDHSVMEDKGISYLANKLGLPYTNGMGCSIDNMGENWRCMVYGGGESFEFTDFSDVKKAQQEGQFFYRVKQDGQRDIDEYIMKQLFKHLA